MILIKSNSKEAAFYFSVEELFTRSLRKKEPVLMIWQTEKTVMLGNNQVVEAEVDTEFALASSVKIVRRSSGGGAIFTDPGTVLYTMIQPLDKDVKTIREEVAETIISSLKKIGVPAKREGRNDILVEGKKVSGFAQYTSGDHVCTHGSLLYDTDLDTLTNVLIANENKLHPKGIRSIRSRVTNIKPYIKEDQTVEDFMTILKSDLINGTDHIVYELNAEEKKIINRFYTEKYANKEWNLRI